MSKKDENHQKSKNIREKQNFFHILGIFLSTPDPDPHSKPDPDPDPGRSLNTDPDPDPVPDPDPDPPGSGSGSLPKNTQDFSKNI